MRDWYRNTWCALTLVVATAALTRECEAQKWVRLGPEGGAVISLATGANGEVLLGTADGHVFASADGGRHWELRGHVSQRWDAVVQKLIVDPAKHERVFAAVWYQDPAAGGGVFCSEDGGSRWRSCGLEQEAVRTLAQAANDAEVLVAGTKTGVFRTMDGGASWQRISPPGDQELKNIDSLAIDPGNPGTIYAGTYHLPWKTTDGGEHWSAIAEGMIDDSDIMSLAIDRGNSQRIFASACSGIYRSEDGGAHWTKLQGIPYSSRRTESLMQDPLNGQVWFAGTTEGLWESEDGGENWKRLTGRSVVVRAVALADSGRRLLAGTEEGILAGDGKEEELRESNAGYSHAVLRSLVVLSSETELLLTSGDEEQRRFLGSEDGGRTWKRWESSATPIRRAFAVPGALVASRAGGGAAVFEGTTRKWRQLKFLTTVRSRTDRNQKSVQTHERFVRPEVLTGSALGGRVFLGTDDGIWSGGIREGVLRRVSREPGPKRIVELTSAGNRLFAIADGGMQVSMDLGSSWSEIEGPRDAGDLLWLQTMGAERVLLGTQRGVYSGAGPGETGNGAWQWRLVQSGLPAAASWPGWVESGIWIVPMKSGGVFLSRDEGRNWERMDEEETGMVRGVFGGERGRIYAQSRTDGVLRLELENWGEHSRNETGSSSNSINH